MSQLQQKFCLAAGWPVCCAVGPVYHDLWRFCVLEVISFFFFFLNDVLQTLVTFMWITPLYPPEVSVWRQLILFYSCAHTLFFREDRISSFSSAGDAHASFLHFFFPFLRPTLIISPSVWSRERYKKVARWWKCLRQMSQSSERDAFRAREADMFVYLRPVIFPTFSSFSVATTPRSSLISPLPHVAEGISSPLIECDTLKALSPPFNVDLMLVKLHSDHLSCQHLPCGGAFGFIHVHRVLCDRLSAFYLRNLKQFLRMEMTRMLTIQWTRAPSFLLIWQCVYRSEKWCFDVWYFSFE